MYQQVCRVLQMLCGLECSHTLCPEQWHSLLSLVKSHGHFFFFFFFLTIVVGGSGFMGVAALETFFWLVSKVVKICDAYWLWSAFSRTRTVATHGFECFHIKCLQYIVRYISAVQSILWIGWSWVKSSCLISILHFDGQGWEKQLERRKAWWTCNITLWLPEWCIIVSV